MDASKRLANLHNILLYSFKSQSSHKTTTTISSHLTSSSVTTSSLLPQAETTCSAQQGPKITVTPPVTQFDETLKITVVGLQRHTKVTIQGWMFCQWHKKEIVLVSHGHFYVDQHGNVDLAADPSLSGSYTGVDAMGLIWSMKPLPSHAQDVRLVIRDVTKPLDVHIAVFSGHITPDDDTLAMTSHQPLAVTSAQRRILAPGVKRIEIREGRIRGTLFLPAGEGTYPGVIDMFGAAGGNMEIRAALLASHGFASLSLAFTRFDDLPGMDQLQFDYFEEAAEWLDSHPSVRRGGIGVVGVSSGGTFAMLMAVHCPQVKAVVEINGPPYQIVHDLYRHGKVFQPSVPMDHSKNAYSEVYGHVAKDMHIVTDKDFFPVWKRNAHVLCLVCQDDKQACWEHAVRLRNLYPPEKRHLIDVIVYPGAGHLFEPPYTPHCLFCYNPGAASNVWWGGKPKPHADAQLDGWKRTIQFLHSSLSDPKNNSSSS